MDASNILGYVSIFVLLIFSLDTFFPGLFRGELIMRLKKPKINEKLRPTIMWGLAIVFFSIFFVISIINYKQRHPYSDKDYYIFQILLTILWVINCLLQLIRLYKPMEIREKGIFVHDGFFYKFKKINFYTWKSPYIMTINYENLLKKDRDFELNFRDQEEALKFDNILQNYVKRV